MKRGSDRSSNVPEFAHHPSSPKVSGTNQDCGALEKESARSDPSDQATSQQQLQHQQHGYQTYLQQTHPSEEQQNSQNRRNQFMSLALPEDLNNVLQQLAGSPHAQGQCAQRSHSNPANEICNPMGCSPFPQSMSVNQVYDNQSTTTTNHSQQQETPYQRSDTPLMSSQSVNSTQDKNKPPIPKLVTIPCRARGMSVEHNFEVRE